MANLETQLAERVRQAGADKTPLCIQGSGSKTFYGRACIAQALDVAGHAGIVDYEPTELVITARAGTPLAEIEAALADKGQMLPFEPPYFGPGATLGGMLATGLSGPRRPWAGAVRDAVLGLKLVNGQGQVLNFGGQVMKNVAGYDVSRLMAGSLGTLGVILEASIKVLPRPAAEITLAYELDAETAASRLLKWMRAPLPMSASLYHEGRLWLRLSGAVQGVAAAQASLGGEAVDLSVWQEVREQTLPFFNEAGRLWRLSLPATAPAIDLPGRQLVEWGGAQRWLVSDAPAETVFARARAHGGHATLFRGHDGHEAVFQPLPETMLQLHRSVKRAMDPHGLFNPGHMYAEL